jgi:hypothetical protein
MPDFTRRFSRYNSGKKPKYRRSGIRIPLDHFECEALAKRINRLMFSGVLTEDERGLLVKKERDLRKVDYILARELFDRPLPRTDCRPMFWDDHGRPLAPSVGRNDTETRAGWVHRLREYVERIEIKHRSASHEDGESVLADRDVGGLDEDI